MGNFATAKEVARYEANRLNEFLETLPVRERGRFATQVMVRIGLDRAIWYNWKYAKCRIPVYAKNLIEEQANCRIFIGTEML